MPDEDNHYFPFSDVFGTQTTEEHRPSLKKKPSKTKKSLPFYASVQHVQKSSVSGTMQYVEANFLKI